MFEALQHFFAMRGLPPHGYCLLWDPTLLWTHVVSDALIGLSYFSIPIVLATFLKRRRDVQFSWAVWMFAAFITACGTTHFLSILVLWVPAYGIEALVKLFTAIVSVMTAVALWFLLPKAIALPSPAQLQVVNAELLQTISQRDVALAALQRESEERRTAEAMLRQAQKMEAVGNLTGGIAHDFNNLLTIVIANLDRAKRLAASDASVSQLLDHASVGADRAAQLIEQLLAFSRKQPLQPGAHNPNDIIAELSGLLQRTIGSQINLKLALEKEVSDIEVDRNQTENAILNLVINARDAMPDGGELTIATRRDAQFVTISVTDTGTGMSPEVLEQAFEPYYTTKGIGKGSGLGLSQVYGFTTQSGGNTVIESKVEVGTTVSMMLPIARTNPPFDVN